MHLINLELMRTVQLYEATVDSGGGLHQYSQIQVIREGDEIIFDKINGSDETPVSSTLKKAELLTLILNKLKEETQKK